ncbi:hypothetical protein PVNG_02473 [Plasmodium vivax North Korean]|uniref:Ribonucleoside-diphosphate reductase n=1 Tax=Plasmodium vivax North Korean TaxID=1035514 RepID=A0A0J9TKV3_PLAVI|nr:hypothetical protein PVNG_02473 [Plasmodium vivax North Korean]
MGMMKQKRITSQAFYNSLIYNNQIMLKGEKGFYSLEKDREAICEYEKYIEENQRYFSRKRGYERINFALRSNCGKYILETYQDRVIVTSLMLGDGNFLFAKKIANLIIRQIYQPATPTFSNAAKKRSGKLVSCFLLETEDSINSINYIISTSMQLSKIGGGVAINLSKLRGRGASIKKIDSTASGVLPVIKILEDVFDYADQLGVRRGSGAAYLSIFHYDLADFIDCKKINADEKSRIQTLSIGVIVPDKFFQLARVNSKFFVFEPNTIFRKYGVHLADMDMNEWYDRLAVDEDILKKELHARSILTRIAQTQFESGYPYVIFIDNANRGNPLKKLGKIKMSNLCTEIFQIQESSTIADYGEKDQIRHDVSCNLASLNLVNLLDSDNLEETIEISMRALSAVSDLTDIPNAPSIKEGNRKFKSVGLGVLNFTGLLIKHGFQYDSPETLEIADILFATINYYSLLASSKIAEEKKKSFEGFELSDYYTGEYFKKYTEKSFLPTSEKIKSLFSR